MIRILLLSVLSVTSASQLRADNITLPQLNAIMMHGNEDINQMYLPYLNEAMTKYGVNTKLRQAHFLAQVAHESGSLKTVKENLNYSEKGLLAVFPKYFRTASVARAYARKPEKIANRVYANRLGNGNEASGDGWKYRGRGLIQLTGKSNYRSYNRDTDENVLENPDLVADNPALAVDVAGWFWAEHNLNPKADRDDVEGITRAINGGTNGLDDRKTYLLRAKLTLEYIPF